MNPLATLSRHANIAVIELDNPPVNAMSQRLRQDIWDCLNMAAGDATIVALVLCCAGRTFVAGADITEFDLPQIAPPDPSDIFLAIESFGRPVIAALHGTALGGGLELALACHYRIAATTTKMGLPEVTLGLLPGAGGTQRLPRLVCVMEALNIMTRGAMLGATEALKIGLIDTISGDAIDHNTVRTDAITWAQQLAFEKAGPRITSELTINTASIAPDFFAAYRKKLPPPEKGGLAAHEIVRCVEAATTQAFAQGLRTERAAFMALKASPDSRALRHIFFAEREATRIPGLAANIKPLPIMQVGIVGAGTMGGGIAMNFANVGIPVLLNDMSTEALERGIGLVTKNYAVTVAKGKLSAEGMAERLALIGTTVDVTALSNCDLVIEAAFENMAIKKSICQQLGAVLKPGAIIASNTSTLNIDVLAAASGRAGDFLGMHFFSPANVMKLLEVVRGAATSPQVLASVMAVAKRIGKSGVVSGVCDGFIGNRMLEGYLRETEFLLMEGATPAQIDRAIEATGMAMGPCRMIDMAGVDVAAKVVLERIAAEVTTIAATVTTPPADASYRAVVKRLYELGRFGQKSALGFYRYDGRNPVDDPAFKHLCADLAQQFNISQRAVIEDAEIVERCMLPLMNEGTKILDEGIAYRASDIDVVWVRGYGFPAYKGGPMHMADTLGAAALCERLAHYAQQNEDPHGYWAASPLLLKLAASGRRLSD